MSSINDDVFSSFLSILRNQEGQCWAQNSTGHLLITYSKGISCRKQSNFFFKLVYESRYAKTLLVVEKNYGVNTEFNFELNISFEIQLQGSLSCLQITYWRLFATIEHTDVGRKSQLEMCIQFNTNLNFKILCHFPIGQVISLALNDLLCKKYRFSQK